MLIYACAVVLMALSLSAFVINIGVADTERLLVTVPSVLLFLLGIYGLYAFWTRRKRQHSSEPV